MGTSRRRSSSNAASWGKGRATEGQQVAPVQVNFRQRRAWSDQATPVEYRARWELPHQSRGHERPRLHPEARLRLPFSAIEREMDDGIAVLEGSVHGVIPWGLGPISVWAIERRLGNHRGFVVVLRVPSRDERIAGVSRAIPRRIGVRFDPRRCVRGGPTTRRCRLGVGSRSTHADR